jgi:hypothetical protein
MSVIPALRRLRQEDLAFETSLGHKVRLSQTYPTSLPPPKKINKRKKKHIFKGKKPI